MMSKEAVPNESWKDRVRHEHGELFFKTEKLRTFTKTMQFKEMHTRKQMMLETHLSLMDGYLWVLAMRLADDE